MVSLHSTRAVTKTEWISYLTMHLLVTFEKMTDIIYGKGPIKSQKIVTFIDREVIICL